MTRAAKLESRIDGFQIHFVIPNRWRTKSLANRCRIRVQGAAVNFKPLKFLQQAKDPATANLGSNNAPCSNPIKSSQIKSNQPVILAVLAVLASLTLQALLALLLSHFTILSKGPNQNDLPTMELSEAKEYQCLTQSTRSSHICSLEYFLLKGIMK